MDLRTTESALTPDRWNIVRSKGGTIIALLGLMLFFCHGCLGGDLGAFRREDADSETSSYSMDAGPRVGIGTGFQANGGGLGDRWAITAFYELRSPNAFSFVAQYQIWKGTTYFSQGQVNNEEFTTRGMFDLAFKFRCVVKRINFGLRGGVGTGLGMSAISFHYASSVEYLLDEKFSIELSQKKYAYKEIGHLFFVGLAARI